MKKKILLFESIATLFVVGIGTVVASGIGQLDKLVATPNYTEHTITFTAENVVDANDSGDGSWYFGLSKQNATLSGFSFETGGSNYVYGGISSFVGGEHIFSIVSAGNPQDYSTHAYFGINFAITNIVELINVTLNGNFIDVYGKQNSSLVYSPDDCYSYDYVTIYEGQLKKAELDSLVITYRCA